MALEVSLGAAAAPHSHADERRIDAQLRPVLDHDPGQVLAVGDGEGVSDRREPRKTLPRKLGGLVAFEQDRHGHLALPRAQDRGRPVAALDGEAEGAQKVGPSTREHSPRAAPRLVPVRPGAHTRAQFVRGQKALVAQAGQVGLERREHVAQRPQGRVAVGLLQRLAADALDLSAVESRICRRLVAGRSAERGPLSVQNDEQERRRASGASRLPGRAQRGLGRRSRAFGDEHFEGRGAPAEGQPHDLERPRLRRRDRA